MDHLQIGVNLTSPITAATAVALLQAGDADFCELLIDNFLHLSPETIRASLNGRPVAFHIMNSRFLENEPATLVDIAGRLKLLIAALQPLYVSDHVAYFSHRGRRFPLLQELDYDTEFERVAARVDRWQDLLGTKVLLENYPSNFARGQAQPAFYQRLVAQTRCGILFDMSNAVVAAHNSGLAPDSWLPVIAEQNHFHIAGHMIDPSVPPMAVDSHDRSVAAESLAFAGRVGQNRPARRPLTAVVERDEAIDHDEWRADLVAVRRALAGKN